MMISLQSYATFYDITLFNILTIYDDMVLPERSQLRNSKDIL